jgi:hypothetical protein
MAKRGAENVEMMGCVSENLGSLGWIIEPQRTRRFAEVGKRLVEHKTI